MQSTALNAHSKQFDKARISIQQHLARQPSIFVTATHCNWGVQHNNINAEIIATPEDPLVTCHTRIDCKVHSPMVSCLKHKQTSDHRSRSFLLSPQGLQVQAVETAPRKTQ
jgi:hypothetical protein